MQALPHKARAFIGGLLCRTTRTLQNLLCSPHENEKVKCCETELCCPFCTAAVNEEGVTTTRYITQPASEQGFAQGWCKTDVLGCTWGKALEFNQHWMGGSRNQGPLNRQTLTYARVGSLER